VQRLYTEFILHTFTSCFRLPASDFVSPQAWGHGRRRAARGGNISPPTTWGARIVRGLWVSHWREDVACNVSTRNSFFTRLRPASDFLLPTSHRQGIHASNFYFILPTSASDFVSPPAWRHGRRQPPGANISPLQRGVRGLWVDCGCPTGVKTLRATSLHGIHSSHVYFLLPPSCFRLRLPTGVLPGAKTFRPDNEGCADHGWIWVPTGVKTLRATSLHGIHSSHVYFLLPTSCFRLRLPTGVGSWAAGRRRKHLAPDNEGCVDHGWIRGCPPA
jgi:hypothetical protein